MRHFHAFKTTVVTVATMILVVLLVVPVGLVAWAMHRVQEARFRAIVPHHEKRLKRAQEAIVAAIYHDTQTHDRGQPAGNNRSLWPITISIHNQQNFSVRHTKTGQKIHLHPDTRAFITDVLRAAYADLDDVPAAWLREHLNGMVWHATPTGPQSAHTVLRTRAARHPFQALMLA